jgi:hypothetical protein
MMSGLSLAGNVVAHSYDEWAYLSWECGGSLL